MVRVYPDWLPGTDQLPQAFADTFTDQIYLETPVELIEQNTDGIIMGVSDGTGYSAGRSLCTVPLAVLNQIQFCPQLSNAKVEVSNGGYYYAASTKVFMQFINRFWESEGLNGWGNTDWPEEIWHPTFTQLIDQCFTGSV